MPSFQDSIVIFFIALLIFGPKKLPELARQLGKLMAEFRRASNEFRMQMEDELRLSEQEEQQKKIAAMEAAAPATPAITDGTENTIAPPDEEEPREIHPHELDLEFSRHCGRLRGRSRSTSGRPGRRSSGRRPPAASSRCSTGAEALFGLAGVQLLGQFVERRVGRDVRRAELRQRAAGDFLDVR